MPCWYDYDEPEEKYDNKMMMMMTLNQADHHNQNHIGQNAHNVQ